MAKRKSREDLEVEIELLRKSRLVDIIVPIATTAFKWLGIAVVAYFSYHSINVLSGQDTNADIKLSLMTNILKIPSKLPSVGVGILGLLSGLCGILYGTWQRSLRMATVSHMQGRIKEGEERKDPNRSSSGLTPKGDTRPEDL